MNSQRVFKIKKWFTITLAIVSLFLSLLLCYATILYYKYYSKIMEYIENINNKNGTHSEQTHFMVSLRFNFTIISLLKLICFVLKSRKLQ